MLRLVATQPYHTVQQLSLSTFIPTTINFFAVTHAMDQQMIFTYRFTRSNPHWCPLITQLYVSFLIYVQIIRCMVESDPTRQELVNFYDTLYRHLGLESLVVPGPLVPLFAAITYASSPHEWIGNITPTLPTSTGASGRNGFRLNNRVYMALPSIPFIIDQIHEMVNQVNAGEPNYTSMATLIKNVFSQPVARNRSAYYNVLTPNARYFTLVPYAAAQSFVANLPHLGLPSRLTSGNAALTDEMNLYQFFGFERYPGQARASNWLTTIGPIMSVYSTHFNGSVSLMSISPTGLGASLPVAIYRADSLIIPVDEQFTDAVAADAAAQPPVVAVDASIARYQPHSNHADLNHSAANLSELAEQYSSLALINCDFTTAEAASTDYHGPTNATLRSGSYWNLPTIRSALNVNTAPGLANNIASYYHSSTPVRQ
jgi:hypothetical protein